ncbi:hypothetical protein B0T11DRAFT_83066 [Plectosphaerella cucumerina]|uniref:Uncharacterized protein n=1 Tax=Plectosphaerella cucumerina TaxID=40658 RepID=A0A8K0TLB5_9PEZI|nr:hypothetical protein B0T11DRAFT_83066 [Plectosphaerella cucumerina]
MSGRNTRPTTPSLKLAATAVGGGSSGAGPVGAAMDPASPPQTPTSVSPVLTHDKVGAGLAQIPPYQNFHVARPAVRQGSSIRPTGNAYQFSYTRHPNANRFAQLSPRSSSEEEDDEDEEEDDDDESDDDDEEDDGEDSSSESESATSRRPRSVDDDSGDEVVGRQEEEEESDEEEDDSDDDEHVPHPTRAPQPPMAPQPPSSVASSSTHPIVANLVVEEMSDYDPMADNRSDIMKPTGIESPTSLRARSVSRGAASDSESQSSRESTPTHAHQVRLTHRPRPVPLPHEADRIPELDRGMSNLNCTPEAEDDDDDDAADDFYDADAAAALAEFAAAQRQMRMRRRLSHGSSIGKRTHSERSDSDGEKDWTPLGDDVDIVGGSARRLRRRVGDRRSLIGFQDPPPERIEELEEPDSCAEDGWRAAIAATRGLGGMFDGQNLARELPYYDLEIMEVDDE